jgi:ABC-type lipoprotein release transport system permease subunit
VLALLAVGTLAHVLLTGVQRRRRDLAVLKILGLLRSQLLRVVSWQASALAAVALLVGLPVGLGTVRRIGRRRGHRRGPHADRAARHPGDDASR